MNKCDFHGPRSFFAIKNFCHVAANSICVIKSENFSDEISLMKSWEFGLAFLRGLFTFETLSSENIRSNYFTRLSERPHSKNQTKNSRKSHKFSVSLR